MKQLTIIAFLLFAGIKISFGQFYKTGDPPGNVRWLSFKSDHFKFIFPDEFELQAREYALTFDQAWERITGQLEHKPKPFPVIIHPYVSRSNGIVIWAPKRMEIYPVPPQHIYPQSWIRQLALHETRHVAQISKLNQGFTKLLSVFTGEQAVGVAAGMIPSWFYEGDAVYAETAFSRFGRGRNPSFEMGIKAQVLDDEKIFSYDKSRFGSYKNYVPSHYEYGYQMISHGSAKFGHETWNKTLDFSGRYPFIPFAFRQGMKNQMGLTPMQLYNELISERKQAWEKEISEGISASSLNYSPGKDDYVNYTSPQFISETEIAALKDGPGFAKQIVLLEKNGTERKLHVPGFLSVNRISAKAGKITWSETIPGARWGNQSFSVIKVFNLNTGEETKLTRKTRYYAPALSPSGNYIAAVETDPLNNCFLIILDALSGIVQTKEKIEYGSFLQFPEWTNENELVMTVLDEEGKHIMVFDLTSQSWKKLFSGGDYDLSRPTGNEDHIWFNGTWNGKNDIFMLDRKTGTIYQTTFSRHGAFDPAILNQENIAFQDYTYMGYDIRILTSEDILQIPFNIPETNPLPYYSSQLEEPIVFEPDEEKSNNFQSKPYGKISNLFHFHSWAPFWFDFTTLDPVSNPDIYPGLTLLSQNLINTAESQLSYAYKNKNHFLSNSFIYSGFLTKIDLGMEYGEMPLVYQGRDTVGLEELDNDLLNFRARFYIPLNLTRSRFVMGLTPYLQINYNNSFYHYTQQNEYKRGNVTLDWRLNLYSYLKMSIRDISPRWGQQFRFRGYSSPFEDENFGSIFHATAIIYFPGLLRHHSISIRGDYQKQIPVKYLYQSLADFPRGFEKRPTEILHSIKSDYYFPVLYPDLNIPGVLYLKRIRGTLYWDYAYNQYRVYNEAANRIDWLGQPLSSGGFELIADYHAFRLLFPFSTGVRVNYLPQYGKVTPELIFSINLNVF
jgi:hypothetical protein